MTSADTAHSSVYAAFCHSAKRWPDRPLLNVLPETAALYQCEAGEITYAAMLARIDSLADQFSSAGLHSGTRVFLLLENRPLFFILWLALNRQGISVVPINADARSSELEYLIGHATPSLAISIASHHPLLHKAAQAAHHPLPIIDATDTAFENLPDKIVNHRVTEEHDQSQNAEAALLYTSGTTGQPKACILSNTYFLLSGHWYANAGGLCTLTEDHEKMITPLPLFHMNAMAYSFMAMVTVGGCLTCLDRFHPATWWRSVRESKATCLHYLGVMPTLLMAAERTDEEKELSVRFGFGAGIDPILHQSFEQRFGFPLIEAWAMTETGAGAVIAANHEPRHPGQRCFGRAQPSLECSIVDEQGHPVDADEPGELRVRRQGAAPRYGFFSGYYKDPEATNKAWKDDWFHTGDVVSRNSTGDFFFIDRRKNVIRRSGENIAAVEVESVLLRHAQVVAVGVAAVPDELRGDEVFACVQTDSEPSAELAQQIVSWCLEQLSYFKVPGYIAFVEQLPLTATQKIQRGELKQLATTLLQHKTTVDTRTLKKRRTLT